MKPAMFAEMTHVLGAPSHWDSDKHGECSGLPIEANHERNTLTSEWTLDAEELAAIVAGGRVVLTIFGSGHPVVHLGVRKPA